VANLALWIGVAGIACYLAFALLTDGPFLFVCTGSWQERILIVLRDVAIFSSPIAFVLALGALWVPTRRRVRAAFALVTSIFCATGVFTLGIVTGSSC
jgi:hypothetical protein